MKRNLRLMAMRELLSQRCATVPEMARLYGVSVRTIYDDLQDMQFSPSEFPVGTVRVWSSQALIVKLHNKLSQSRKNSAPSQDGADKNR